MNPAELLQAVDDGELTWDQAWTMLDEADYDTWCESVSRQVADDCLAVQERLIAQRNAAYAALVAA